MKYTLVLYSCADYSNSEDPEVQSLVFMRGDGVCGDYGDIMYGPRERAERG